MSVNIATKKILSEQNISKIIMLGISIRDKLQNAEKGLISEYDETVTYTRGMSCYYNNYLYECKYTTTGTFDESKWQKIGDELDLITKQDIEAMLGLTQEEIETLQKIINDSQITLSTTFSSSKIYTDIQQCLSDSKTYTLKELSKKMGASYKVATSIDEVTSTEFLYLISNGTAYDIYALIDGVTTKIGDTTIDLSQFYTKEQIDNDFLKKVDADGKYTTQTSFNSHTSDTDIHTSATEKASYVKKTDIADNLTSTDTDKPLSANQGKVLKDEIDLKANDNEVVKKTDITTTIDSTSTDDTIPTNKTIWDKYNIIDRTEAYTNIIVDALYVNLRKPDSHLNKDGIVLLDGTNSPEDLVWGIRRVYWRSPGNLTVQINGMDINNTSAVWLNTLYGDENSFAWTGWQKVCTTSVADVPKTAITFTDETYYKNHNSDNVFSHYRVQNGICYMSIYVTCVTPYISSTVKTCTSTVPKPKDYIRKIIPVWEIENSNSNCIELSINDTSVFLRGGTAGESYLLQFSYPVAES